MSIPSDFPRFEVPGHEHEMESLRALFWLHYPGAGPKATLWDEWLPSASLWPAVESDGAYNRMRREWAEVLNGRVMDAEGYVATHQHASIAHQLGWPFPGWHQGQGGWGWHFSFKDTAPPPWRPDQLSTGEGWMLAGVRDGGIDDDGWRVELVGTNAAVTTPAVTIESFQSPFIQLRWRASGLDGAEPRLDWATKNEPDFSPERSVYFEPAGGEGFVYTMIPVYKHPRWTGDITRLRISFGNAQAGALVVVRALFTQYDTRHNINAQNFVRGCATYFRWTRDINFLRANINRMRLGLRYVMVEHHALERKAILTDWVGHDGRSGLRRNPDGTKTILSGHGIGNNYWDIMPFGCLDTYATVQYYDALRSMAAIERDVLDNPEWNIPRGALALEPATLLDHAEEVKREGNRIFWNAVTGRFVAGVDADGNKADYGFTFLNLEAVYYDFATPDHAQAMMSWICGDRVVEGDTAQGDEIYHWRFAPRSTTKRNLDYYGWFWSSPESIPWGGQVQDGGAVLGFSYHDLMARVKTRGPDNAWERLREIIRWFDEVQAAGGYRAYYDGRREGTLQGGGTAGGLGLDQEFFESVLVPQVMLYGFLGFAPESDGLRLDPKLPRDWPELTIDRIRLHNVTLRIRATPEAIEIWRHGPWEGPSFIRLPRAEWRISSLAPDGTAGPPVAVSRRASDGAVVWEWGEASGVRIERVGGQR